MRTKVADYESEFNLKTYLLHCLPKIDESKEIQIWNEK